METKKFEKKKVGSSIESPSAKSYSSASGRFFHSGSHIEVISKNSIENGIIADCQLSPSAKKHVEESLPPEQRQFWKISELQINPRNV